MRREHVGGVDEWGGWISGDGGLVGTEEGWMSGDGQVGTDKWGRRMCRARAGTEE